MGDLIKITCLICAPLPSTLLGLNDLYQGIYAFEFSILYKVCNAIESKEHRRVLAYPNFFSYTLQGGNSPFPVKPAVGSVATCQHFPFEPYLIELR